MSGPSLAGDEIVVERVEWRAFGRALAAVRTAVFVDEQGVPSELEIDGRDADAVHVAAFAGGRVVGTGRLLHGGRIGRMAVLKDWRGRGIGAALLGALLEAARRRGDAVAMLTAQTGAVRFYARHGFLAEGEPFVEAGIVHQWMKRPLRGRHGD